MKKISTLVTALLLLTNFAFSQTKSVDNFINGDDSITVFFYDPLLRINKLDKDFQSKPDKEKSDALNKYLHENPLYLFRLTNAKTKDIRYLCISGNPEKEKTKMFYKVEVIKNMLADFNPNNNNYSDKIVQVIDQVNCGGTLFENMSLFDSEENKKLVGNGIELYGYYRRVQPYLEIKTSIIYIIEQQLDKK
ncbi:MAG: hypothetical protein ABI861_14030 [Panacibacter sp.]